MKHAQGKIDLSLINTLKEAYNQNANSFAESCDDTFDFKTCQRSDGTVYGTAGDCAQKGAKEVKKSESKKSSWDDSNLAGKMGREVSKVAGPAMRSSTAGELAVEKGLNKSVEAMNKMNSAIDEMNAGRMTEKQVANVVRSSYIEANKGAIEAVNAANKQVASGEAKLSYAKRIRKFAVGEVNKFEGTINYAVGQGHITRPSLERVPAAGAKPASSGNSLSDDLKSLGFEGGFAGLMQASNMGNKQEFKWPDGMYRTGVPGRGPRTTHSSYEAAKAHLARLRRMGNADQTYIHPLHN